MHGFPFGTQTWLAGKCLIKDHQGAYRRFNGKIIQLNGGLPSKTVMTKGKCFWLWIKRLEPTQSLPNRLARSLKVGPESASLENMPFEVPKTAPKSGKIQDWAEKIELNTVTIPTLRSRPQFLLSWNLCPGFHKDCFTGNVVASLECLEDLHGPRPWRPGFWCSRFQKLRLKIR